MVDRNTFKNFSHLKKLLKLLLFIFSIIGFLFLVRIITFYTLKPNVTLSRSIGQCEAELKNDVLNLSFGFSANWDEQCIIEEILVYFPKYIEPVIPSIYEIDAHVGRQKIELFEGEILINNPYNIFNGKNLTEIGLNPFIFRIVPIAYSKLQGNTEVTFWLEGNTAAPINEFEVILLFVVRKDLLELGWKRFFVDQGPWLIKRKKIIQVNFPANYTTH